MNNKLVTLISLKMAERGEAKNRKEELRVKNRNLRYLTRKREAKLCAKISQILVFQFRCAQISTEI
jgi:hypothetical protein